MPRTSWLLVVTLAACGRSSGAAAPLPLAYVSDERAGRVDVIDLASGTRQASIEVGKRPRGLRLSPDGRHLYVALSGSPVAGPHVDPSTLPPADRSADGIAVVDLASRQVERVLASGRDPESFDLSRDGRRLYVSNEETAEVSVVDVATGHVRARLAVGGEPEGVTTRPDGGVVYVTSEEDGTVSVIDTATDVVIATIAVGARPRSVLFTPDSTMAFVANERDATVSFVDARRHEVRHVVEIPPGPGRFLPMGLCLSPDGRTLYVSGGRGGAVAAIDVARRSVAGSFTDVGARPWGLACDGHTLVSANGPSGDVSLIDAHSGAVRARIATGGSPWGVALGSR